MTSTSFEHLDRAQRRALARRTALRIALTAIVLSVLYVALPLADETGTRVVFWLLVGMVAFVLTLTWQLRSIVAADHPELRAVEALVVAVLTLVFVFAYTYASMSSVNPGSFSEPLNHVDALYFVMTTLSTVGYGDIVATSSTTRALITGQLILDVVIVAGLARTAVIAVKLGLRRQAAGDDDDDDDRA